jgi:hypothetical protein
MATGTPAGVGGGLDPPRFLADGDVVEVEGPGDRCLAQPDTARELTGFPRSTAAQESSVRARR